MDKKTKLLKGEIYKENSIPVASIVLDLKGPIPSSYGGRTGSLKQTKICLHSRPLQRDEPLYWGPSSKVSHSDDPG